MYGAVAEGGRGGGKEGGGFLSLAPPAFLPSVSSSFLTQNKGGPGPSPRSATTGGAVGTTRPQEELYSTFCSGK